MNVNLSKWSDEHGVIREIIPFARLEYDPLELCAFVRSEIERAPQTKKYFKQKTIAKKIGRTANDKKRFITAFALAGSWLHADGTYANPAYCHSHHLPTNSGNSMERREYIADRARYGIVDLRDIAPRFQLTRNGIRAWVRRKSIPVQKWKQQGQQRIYRSIHTMCSWQVKRKRIGRAFGLSANRISEIHTSMIESAYDPPVRPTYEDKPGVLRVA